MKTKAARTENAKRPRKRSPLQPWQIEDAARLKALWMAYSDRPGSLSQLEFGAAYGIGNQGAVWQYLNARTALNLEAAVRFAIGLNVGLDEISPTLFREFLAPLPSAPLSAAAQSIGQEFDALPTQQQETVRSVIRACAEAAIAERARDSERKKEEPVPAR